MNRSALPRREPALVATMLAAMLALTLLPSGGASAQAAKVPKARHYPLESAAGVRPNNVTAEPVTHQGKKGLRVTFSPEARTRTRAERTTREIAVLEGTEFSSGVIEAEIAGGVEPGAPRTRAASWASRSGCRTTCGPSTCSSCVRPMDAPTIRCVGITRCNAARIRTGILPACGKRRRKNTSRRRPRPGCLDGDQNRSERRTRAFLRARPRAADADRQRPQDRRRTPKAPSPCGSTSTRRPLPAT